MLEVYEEHVNHFKLLIMLLLTNIKEDKYQFFIFFLFIYNFWAGCNTFYMFLFLSLPFLLFPFTWQLFLYWNLKNEILTVWKIYKSHFFCAVLLINYAWSHVLKLANRFGHRVYVSCVCVHNVYIYIWRVCEV